MYNLNNMMYGSGFGGGMLQGHGFGSMQQGNMMQGNMMQGSGNGVAAAYMQGSPRYPHISGWVMFFEVPGGTQVLVNLTGLPAYRPASGKNDPVGPHGFHIHGEGDCTVGNTDNPFQKAGEHWNPDNQPHGNHAGDFPVLFSNNGTAIMSFFTSRFKPGDVIGKSVIIHENPDDYRSQPAGDAGERIACGVIRLYWM